MGPSQTLNNLAALQNGDVIHFADDGHLSESGAHRQPPQVALRSFTSVRAEGAQHHDVQREGRPIAALEGAALGDYAAQQNQFAVAGQGLATVVQDPEATLIVPVVQDALERSRWIGRNKSKLTNDVHTDRNSSLQ